MNKLKENVNTITTYRNNIKNDEYEQKMKEILEDH